MADAKLSLVGFLYYINWLPVLLRVVSATIHISAHVWIWQHRQHNTPVFLPRISTEQQLTDILNYIKYT